MASTKAQLAKDKGNAAFKGGDYAVAIGLYTEAIQTKPDDPTFPLNRAAAYLKLGKNEDAERDCTTVLKLHTSNVKALFRRGQARIALNKVSDAQKDLKEALRLEPANESVKQELENVENLLLQGKSKQGVNATVNIAPSLSVSTLPRRRRIPIKIVESTSGPSSKAPVKTKTDSTLPKESTTTENDLMKPISSRSLSTSSSSAVTKPKSDSAAATDKSTSLTFQTSTPKLNTFKAAKHARESTKPSRAGGGIFRSSGDHTIIENEDKKGVRPSGTPASSPPLPLSNVFSSAKPPMTLYNFTRSWESLDSAEQRWNLISQIPPTTLPALFQTLLEPSLLGSILDTFLTILKQTTDPENGDRVRMRQYMAMFSKVPRFSTVVLFMSAEEKKLAKEVWEKVGVRNGCAAWGISIE